MELSPYICPPLNYFISWKLINRLVCAYVLDLLFSGLLVITPWK